MHRLLIDFHIHKDILCDNILYIDKCNWPLNVHRVEFNKRKYYNIHFNCWKSIENQIELISIKMFSNHNNHFGPCLCALRMYSNYFQIFNFISSWPRSCENLFLNGLMVWSILINWSNSMKNDILSWKQFWMGLSNAW